MASSAEVIGAAIYHALGYNVVEGYVVDVDPARIVIAPNATIVDMSGRRRPMRRSDIDRLLERAARLPNGKYRATASRFAEGIPLGYFKYYGTRPDDPNDIHPHEHRRELRGSRVFAAWLNHDDSRGLNSLDMLEGPPERATSGTTCSTSVRSWAAEASSRRCRARATNTSSNGHPAEDAGHASA
jgi:hypothetical protein